MSNTIRFDCRGIYPVIAGLFFKYFCRSECVANGCSTRIYIAVTVSLLSYIILHMRMKWMNALHQNKCSATQATKERNGTRDDIGIGILSFGTCKCEWIHPNPSSLPLLKPVTLWRLISSSSHWTLLDKVARHATSKTKHDTHFAFTWVWPSTPCTTTHWTPSYDGGGFLFVAAPELLPGDYLLERYVGWGLDPFLCSYTVVTS